MNAVPWIGYWWLNSIRFIISHYIYIKVNLKFRKTFFRKRKKSFFSIWENIEFSGDFFGDVKITTYFFYIPDYSICCTRYQVQKFFLFLVQVAGTLCIEGHFEKNFVGHFTAFSTVTNPENEIFVNIFHVFQTSLVSVLNVINLTKFLLKT